MKNFISDLAGLRQYYDAIGAVRWKLYNGLFSGNLPQGNVAAAQPNAEMDKEESYALLEQMINLHNKGAGTFTVYFPTNGNGNMGHRTYLQLNANSNTAAVGAVPGPGSHVAGYIPESEVQKRIDDALERYELMTRVEMLEAQNEPTGILERLIDKALENPNVPEVAVGAFANLCNVIATKIGGTAATFSQPVQVNGTPQTAEPTEMTEEEEAMIQTALIRINQHFPKLGEFMQAVANKVDENPAMAKMLFAQSK